ncbi:MAG TPA: flippase activity-associated protein Agl23 [Pyrinomonadaceae bacterium]
MSTRSTRSGSAAGKKQAAKRPVDDKSQFSATDPPPPSVDISERAWKIAAISIFLVAAVLRVYDLTLVPLHHDEGVNGNFLVRLVRDGAYQYDPANYHGPTLYYFSAFVPWLLRFLFGVSARETYGLSTVAIRLVPALFGLGTVWLVFLMRRYIGTIAALTGALLLAISPGAVYLSRYYIHETLFVFFTLGIVVAALKFYLERNGWYLLVAAGSAALLFATKETAMISAAVLLIALAITRLYVQLVKKADPPTKTKKKRAPRTDTFAAFLEEIGGPLNLAVWVTLALLVFFGLNVIFYSSFFTNYPKGVYDALRTFEFWSKTGKDAHVHPFHTYLVWLFKQESGLLFLGILGAALTVLRPKRPVVLFCALWAFGLIAAYSLIPYKTPWLALNFIVPLAIVAGYAIQEIYEMNKHRWRSPFVVPGIAVVLGVALIVGTFQTIDLNFVNYDNDSTYYVYVYAHTHRETKTLVDEVDKAARRANQGITGITIMSPDYWPLPWYFRNYSRVGYYGRITQTTEPIVIASETQRNDVESNLGPQYRLVPSGSATGAFPLRPGVELLLYVRQAP